MAHVAFLGTGLLGAGMVERMLAQGTRVTVWNRTAAKARALEDAGATVVLEKTAGAWRMVAITDQWVM